MGDPISPLNDGQRISVPAKTSKEEGAARMA